jgi:hypothetical protein
MQKQTDRELDGFSGAVQSVSEEIAYISKRNDRWIIHPRGSQIVLTYNPEGERTDETFRAPAHSNQSDLQNVAVTKDADGKITSYSCHRDGTLQFKVFFAYDENDNKTEETTYNSKGELDHITHYKYDSKKKIIEMSTYNSDDTLQDRHTYTNEYDATGNLIKVIVRRWTNVNGEMIYEPLCEIYYEITYY